MSKTPKELRKLHNSMKTRFDNQVGVKLKEVRDYILPELGLFEGEKRSIGTADRRARKIVMSSAQLANRTLASGFLSGLIPPAQKWFRWRPSDDKKMEMAGVADWFSRVEKKMYEVLAQSNFYSAMSAAYTELGAFGIFDVMMEEDEKDLVRFTHLPVGSYYWSLDSRGRVDTVCRMINFTARQLVQKYGKDKVSKGTLELYNKGSDEDILCYHFVMPRKDINPEALDRLNMPYASYMIEAKCQDDEGFLEESGYREFPHLCAHWFQYGQDVYSPTCPGIDTLPDVMQLQQQASTVIKGGHLTLFPPMRVPSNYSNRLNLMPQAQNAVDSSDPAAISPLYQINPAFLNPLTQWIQTVLVPTIESHFFKDVFRMFTGEERSNITATEIVERKQEKLLEMGFVVLRQQVAVLDPMLERLFSVLFRNGMLPDAPKELGDDFIKTEYLSILAQAQKSADKQALIGLIEYVERVAQGYPAIMDKIDFDQSVDEMAQNLGAPTSIVASDDKVAMIREQRLKAAQQMQQMQQMQAGLAAGQAASNISTEGGNLMGDAAKLAGVGNE